jgi:tetratricopeptide (TPR) repeat protein
MHMLEMLALFQNHRGSDMEAEARSFVGKIKEGVRFYEASHLARGIFMLGVSSSLQGRWREAVGFYSQALEVTRPTDPYRSGSYLYRGKAYDAIGERDLAVRDYRESLRGPKLWNSHEEAKHHLRYPYRPAQAQASLRGHEGKFQVQSSKFEDENITADAELETSNLEL